ncbi:MAG: hypothetical protein K6F82_06705 [Sphaerochaetaceae bacterium]|nr:hypothetical protein [Sphaerochaetaceae bacterium]
MSVKKLALLLSIITLISLAVLAYFFLFKEVVFVTDPAWELVEPASEMRRLRLNLALKGRKLTCIDFEDFFSDTDRFTNCNLIVLSPVSSVAAVTENAFLSSESECIVAGIGAEENYSVFDMVLKSYQTEEIEEDAVDYRYSAYTSAERVYCPYLTESILPLLSLTKEDIHGTPGVLVYGYR